MQPLTAQDFTYNLFALKYLRGIPSIPLKIRILHDRGEGGPSCRRVPIRNRSDLLRRFNQTVVLLQYLLELRMRNGVNLEVVDALHGLGGDQGVDHRLLH
jgi:hypothetical protein